VSSSSSENCTCQGTLHTGWDANGMMSDEIRKNSISRITFHARICLRQERLPEIVVENLSGLKEARRNFRSLRHPILLLMQGYPIRILPNEVNNWLSHFVFGNLFKNLISYFSNVKRQENSQVLVCKTPSFIKNIQWNDEVMC
jgi:hypothetical protein